ncbi:hypothetical protein MPSEU_000108500 [Mayamaea pseudoterrestris]|nr:hypothetical protein MPSEU_000108500 [Mayamaea pseudoterrestris]
MKGSSRSFKTINSSPSSKPLDNNSIEESDDAFANFDDNMEWAGNLLDQDDEKSESGRSPKKSSKKAATDIPIKLPTRQASVAHVEWPKSGTKSHTHDAAALKSKSDHAVLSPSTPRRSSRNNNKLHSSSHNRHEESHDKKAASSSSKHNHLRKSAPNVSSPSLEEIQRAEEILRLAAKSKDGNDEILHRSTGSRHRSDAGEVKSAAEQHESSSKGQRKPSKQTEHVDDEIPRHSRRSNQSSSGKQQQHASQAALPDYRQSFNKLRREKSLDDMMGLSSSHHADHHSESDVDDDNGSVVSKTRQTARRGRSSRRQSCETPTDRSLSRCGDRSASLRRRASVAVGGVEEIRARSLSRTKRRGSMNHAAAAPVAVAPERSMLGDQSDSEKNEDDDLDFEAMNKRRDILNQSRKGPIVSEQMRHSHGSSHNHSNSSNSNMEHHPGSGHFHPGGHEESSEFSLSSASSPQRSRKPVDTDDWERGLDDVLSRRHAAREGGGSSSNFDSLTDHVSPKSQRHLLGNDRRGVSSNAAIAGPKIDLSKMTVPIASPTLKKKGWGARLQQIGVKGKDRKNAV